MVAHPPSVILPDDDDDSVELTNKTDFFSDEDHAINELLNNNSWMREDISVAETEDDELRIEMEMLTLAEREVSQEISYFVESFREQSGVESDGTIIEYGKRKSNSTISAMNEIYTGIIEREDNYTLQEQREMANQETIKVRGKKKSHANISNIHEVNIGMIEKETRDSPSQSQPSDEACNGIYGIFNREPPEEIIFVDDDESNDEDEYSNTIGDIVIHMSTSVAEVEDAPEAVETDSVNYQEAMNESFFVEQREEDEESAMLSEWELRSRQLSDLEKGENNIFEEETFWDDSFWKIPVHQPTSQNTATLIQREHKDKIVESERSKIPPISKTRRGIIDMLSLPTLEHRRDENQENVATINHQSVEPSPEESVQESVDTSAESHLHGNGRGSRKSPRKSQKHEPASWEASRTLHENIEDQFSIPTQTQYNNHTFALDRAIPNEGEGSTTVNEGTSCKRNSWCNRRILVVAVQAILTVIGVIIFWQFLLTKDSRAQQSYTHEVPVNNNCSVVVKDLQPLNSNRFLTPSINTRGTLLGATKENNPCDISLDHAGVWFSVTGTGGPMTASTQTESAVDIRSSIIFGQCNDLVCITSSESSRDTGGVSSSTWMSVAGESYHILVHGQVSLAGNFSLSLSEATSRNSECEAAPSLLPSNYASGISISGTMKIPVIIDKNETICDYISEIGSVTWYSVTGNGKFLSASICDDLESLFDKDINIQLFTGRCNELTCFPMEDETNSPTLGSKKEIRWLSVPEERYYLSIWSSKKETTKFKLCLDQLELGSSCQSALPANVFSNGDGNYEITGSIGETARNTNNIVIGDDFLLGEPIMEGNYCREEPPSTPSRWYTFTGTGSRMIATTCLDVSNNISTTALFDVFMGPTCSTLECVTNGRSRGCGSTNGQQFLSWDTIADQKYWILVYGETRGDQGKNFTLNLRVSDDGLYDEPVLLDEENTSISIPQGEERVTGRFWVVLYVSVCLLCTLLAFITWKWRKSKHRYTDD